MNSSQHLGGPVVVLPPDGPPRVLAPSQELVFGRDWSVDLTLDGDASLSRRAGRITATANGAFIDNLSAKRALHVLVGDERMRLAATTGEGVGILVTAGEVQVGTSTMLQSHLAITVRLGDRRARPRADRCETAGLPTTGTVITLKPLTKEFMVAFLLCRPWLLDTTRTTPLPTTPEIGRQALELTSALHLLHDYSTGPVRPVITARVNNHLNELRAKLRAAPLVSETDRLGLPSIAATLLNFDVITPSHLVLPADPRWLTTQENLWWTTA